MARDCPLPLPAPPLHTDGLFPNSLKWQTTQTELWKSLAQVSRTWVLLSGSSSCLTSTSLCIGKPCLGSEVAVGVPICFTIVPPLLTPF